MQKRTAATQSKSRDEQEREAQEAELVDRLIASAAGLPRVCAFKRCRRGKRCFGGFGSGAVPCLSQHQGLARARFKSALKRLGWDKPRAGASPSVAAR